MRSNVSDSRKYGADTYWSKRPGTFRRGNPGRPKGARNKATLAAMALLEGEAEARTRKAVELALAGDTVALKLVLDRLLPRERTIRLDLPLRTLADLDRATATIRTALSRGRITLSEVGVLARLLETRRRLIETTELEPRLAALELARPA